MEYLTITGSVRLKRRTDEAALTEIINKLKAINFDDEGSATISRHGDVLSMNIDGEISDDVGIEVILLLQSLNAFMTDNAVIVVNRIRWEINITLECKEDDSSPLGTYLSNFLYEHESNQLILI